MRARYPVVFLAILHAGLLVVTGCSPSSGQPTPPLTGPEEEAEDALPRLPGIGAPVGDMGPGDPLLVEEWVGAADLVVVGTVSAVTPKVEPIVVNGNFEAHEGEHRLVLESAEACRGHVKGGFDLHLENVDVLYGSPTTSSLTITYGYYLARPTSADPVWTMAREDGGYELDWRGEGRFVPGQRIVAALFHDSRLDAYTPGVFEPVYQLRYDSQVTEPRYAYEGTLEGQSRTAETWIRSGLDWLEGRTVAELEARIAEIEWEDPEIVALIEARLANMIWRIPMPEGHDRPEANWASLFYSVCEEYPYTD